MKEENIEREGEKVLEELSRALGDTRLEETYYLLEDLEIYREDSEPSQDEDFRRRALKNAPSKDREGYFIAEVGTWSA